MHACALLRPVIVCVKVFVQIQIMHERGLFHLDVRPEHVMLKTPRGNTDPLQVPPQDLDIFLIDMGCAALASGINREVSVDFLLDEQTSPCDLSFLVKRVPLT